ncbi:MAG: extracellular solute-binding protein [Alphaproteobacteria bacterium]
MGIATRRNVFGKTEQPQSAWHALATKIAAAVFSLSLAMPLAAHAQDNWETSTALVGEPQYAGDFKHFNYVNPDAPKGGTVRLATSGTFDTLNVVPQRGNAGVGIGLIYDTLMTSSLDEISAMYPLIATRMSHPEDYSSVTFQLHPDARWHDGEPLTSEDVAWSFAALTENNRVYQNYYKHVTDVKIDGPHEVTFVFDETGNRELPHIVGQLTILPKHWWEGTDEKGVKRDVTKGTLEAPLGSSAYKIGRVVPGRSITYERVADYWGRDLPVNVGQNNFDNIRYEYFRDSTVEMEAFKSDDYDYRVESTARVWATGYDFPAVETESVVKQEFDERGRGLMVGFIPNLRREKFQDVRVRKALNYAFDFEEMNKTIFFGQYDRIDSYFYGDELASSGVPQGLEFEILESVREKVPAEVFTTPFENPAAGDTRAYRTNLREAVNLFREAGYKLKDGKMVHSETGEPFTIEYLLNSNRFEKIALRLKSNFERIGVDLQVRIVDSSQWVNRVRSRDFDFIYSGWAQSLSPGNEQLEYFGSAAADQESARNWAGVKDVAVDALIQRIIFAKDRDELIAATKAMDRVLLANHYIIPGWTLLKTRTARWDRFSHPEVLPAYNEPAFPTIWWYNEEKAARVEASK